MSQAIACLDFIWDEAPILNRMINVCLIQEELDKAPIELCDVELQRGMTHEKLENLVADNLTVVRLHDRVAEGCVESYFESHHADFDTAYTAQIECADEVSARRMHQQILAGEVDFYAAAQNHFLSSAGQRKRVEHLVFTALRRSEATEEQRAAIFAAAPGDVVGPVRLADGYAIACMLSFTPARLDEPTRTAIKELVFEAWLAERRRTASAEKSLSKND